MNIADSQHTRPSARRRGGKGRAGHCATAPWLAVGLWLCCASTAQAAPPAAAAPQQATAPSSAAPLQALGCLIEADRVADIGSPVIGVVERVEVERGDPVRKGQVLAVLRSDVERAALDVARLRAESGTELQAATANAQFLRDRRQRAEDLFKQQFISQQALDQARNESEVAEQKLALAREQRRVSGQERDVAAAQVAQRVIRSPFDGVVAERHVGAGERVDERPLFRVAKVNPLRVQLVLPVAHYRRVRLGDVVSVLPDLPGAAAAAARVTMVDKVVDAASNTFRMHLELPNADGGLPAGLRCRAEFGMAAAPSTPASPTSPTTPADRGAVN
jgi:RND family efflux transporter MFP subunit